MNANFQMGEALYLKTDGDGTDLSSSVVIERAYFIHVSQRSDMMTRECGMHIYSWQQQHFFALGLELQILVKLMQFCVTPLWNLRCIWASEDRGRRHFNLFCLMKKTCQLMPSKNVTRHELAHDDSSNISCVSLGIDAWGFPSQICAVC